MPPKLKPEIIKNENYDQTQQGVRLPFSRYALFFALGVIGLAADLWTKSFMFANYFVPANEYQEIHFWVDGIFGIQCSTNPGALFGIGRGYSWLFAILSFVALAGVMVWLFVFRAAMDWWLTVSLGIITGGILGNLYDRLGLGYLPEYPDAIRTNVRDWIYFRLEGWPMLDPWPNFNIADSLLVTGAIMLFVHALFFAEDEPVEESKSGDE